MVSCELRRSSVLIRVVAAGTAVATRIAIGTIVQMISTVVLCTSEVSATAPRDLRNARIE